MLPPSEASGACQGGGGVWVVWASGGARSARARCYAGSAGGNGGDRPTAAARPCFLRSAFDTRPAPPAAATADILLGFKASIANFAEVQVARGLHGWSTCPATDCLLVCSWGGVLCNADNNVEQL